MKLASARWPEIEEFFAAMTKAELDFLVELSDSEILYRLPVEEGSQLKRGSC